MNYWIFSVVSHKEGKDTYKAEDVFNQRMIDGFWGLGEKTPNRKYLSEGDKVVYYIGIPQKYFGGTASLASDSFALNNSQKKKFSHGKQYYTVDYGVLLKDIEIWQKKKPVDELLPQLRFIENKEFWGAYLQGGVRQIEADDYSLIVGEPSLIQKINSTSDVENQNEFAMEMQLEEFIFKNWSNINWGSKLVLFENEEQNGRQFPAGTWSIDFLAKDKVNDDLVVIELKRGKTSDSTVGQLLRYIGWVKENIASKHQNVRGIIIAHEVDEALKYAVKNLNNIDVKQYTVNFRLTSA
ncbi:MAG: endonuclease NucS domain-containing protein [Dehalococcoidales bacterium]